MASARPERRAATARGMRSHISSPPMVRRCLLRKASGRSNLNRARFDSAGLTPRGVERTTRAAGLFPLSLFFFVFFFPQRNGMGDGWMDGGREGGSRPASHMNALQFAWGRLFVALSSSLRWGPAEAGTRTTKERQKQRPEEGEHGGWKRNGRTKRARVRGSNTHSIQDCCSIWPRDWLCWAACTVVCVVSKSSPGHRVASRKGGT